MALIFTVTDAGRAALVNAANNGTNAVLVASAGLSATAVVPDRTMTALPGQFKTLATLSGAGVAADIIHLIIRDESTAAFALRSVGLYLADGTLFGIYGQADPIVEKTAASLMLLEVNVQFADIAADSITFGNANFLNPPATQTTMGIAELATQPESDAGTDDQRIVTPKKMKTSVLAWVTSWFSDVWRASNDGAGSGLDADLLDGQQGSWYSDIIARLGFTPLNTENYTAADIKNKLVTVDGSGSGVDADLLDGQHGSWYSDIVARLGFTPLNTANYTATDIRNKLVTVDGSGSGVDADLLDGQHGAHYNDLANATGTLANGRLGGSYDGITEMAMTRIRLTSTTDASLSSTNHAIQVGPDSGTNLIIDNNEIMVRSAGASATFYINADGGTTAFGGDVTVGTGNLSVAGNIVWNSGNDGAGSGCDADLLDGQHGTYYRDLGNATGKASPSVLPFLEGSESTGYARLNASGDATVGGSLRITTGGVTLDYIFNNTRVWRVSSAGNMEVTGAATIGGNTAWHAGNDGSGSGVDADLLDGRHASDFLLATDATKFGSNANGNWERRANGMIEQWGVVIGSHPQGVHARSWPTPYQEPATVNLQITPLNSAGGTASAYDWWGQVKSVSQAGFEMVSQGATDTVIGAGYHWRAIGK